MKRWICLVLAMLMLFAVAGCSSTPTDSGKSDDANKVYRFAIVFNGPVSDGGWNQNAWAGLEKLKEEYGDKVEITYAEKIDQADYEDTFYGYAKDGYDMIFANGFEFSDAALRVADEFKNVHFGIINGLEYRENVCGLEFDNVELGYIAGIAAGIKARELGTNVAFIGAEEIPSYKNYFAGFTAAIASVSPNVQAKAFYTGDWSDITKATEIANTAISAGYGVLVPWVGAVNHAIYAAAQEKNVPFLQTSMQMDSTTFDNLIILNTDQSGSAMI